MNAPDQRELDAGAEGGELLLREGRDEGVVQEAAEDAVGGGAVAPERQHLAAAPAERGPSRLQERYGAVGKGDRGTGVPGMRRQGGRETVRGRETGTQGGHGGRAGRTL